MADRGAVAFEDVRSNFGVLLPLQASYDSRRPGQVPNTGAVSGVTKIFATGDLSPRARVMMYETRSGQLLATRISDPNGAYTFAPMEPGVNFFYLVFLQSDGEDVRRNGVVLTDVVPV